MSARVVALTDLKSIVGQELGVSDWYLVTQEGIDKFADATHDHQWIHVDPQRAKKESPFGTTVAHGYYTLALAPFLLPQILEVTGARMGVNYGLNTLRFMSAVRVGRRLQLRASVQAVDDIIGGVQVTFALAFQVEREPRPACIAEAVYRYYA
jgi:acyl dehydratase